MDDIHSLVERIGQSLEASGFHLATAESCTGGLISSTLTDVSGSSNWFFGGVVAYANAIKADVLGVREETLMAHGAVSEPCVVEMALGAAKLLGAEVSLAVSGIAGPTGGTREKPVGTVCFAWHTPAGTSTETLCFTEDRAGIKAATTAHCLNRLAKLLHG